jgi:hypothetical protein
MKPYLVVAWEKWAPQNGALPPPRTRTRVQCVVRSNRSSYVPEVELSVIFETDKSELHLIVAG